VTFATRIVTSASLLALTLAATSAFATTPPATADSTVVYSTPNDIVVKRASDGQLVNYTIPAGATISVAGKKVPASDVKPGTKLTDALPGDPKIVSGIAVAKGKVYQIDPPDKVTLSLAEGIKELTIPAGTTFTVAGKKVPASQLQKGMEVEATVVSTLAGPEAAGNVPPSDTPNQTGVILLAVATGDDLPAAGTNLPLFGILGFIALALGLALRSNRFALIKA
jgi:hypothetical protein